jgi:exodeoxyribonuclease-3
MAYRNKVGHILKYDPDIVIIPECEKFGEQLAKRLWIGDNPKKGLGVFSYSTFASNFTNITILHLNM